MENPRPRKTVRVLATGKHTGASLECADGTDSKTTELRRRRRAQIQSPPPLGWMPERGGGSLEKQATPPLQETKGNSEKTEK